MSMASRQGRSFCSGIMRDGAGFDSEVEAAQGCRGLQNACGSSVESKGESSEL
jgi:hypothetical protein